MVTGRLVSPVVRVRAEQLSHLVRFLVEDKDASFLQRVHICAAARPVSCLMGSCKSASRGTVAVACNMTQLQLVSEIRIRGSAPPRRLMTS